MHFQPKPTCVICQKSIDKDEQSIVKVRYPVKKGITEIQAYLRKEGIFYCATCAQQMKGQ